VLEMLSLVGGVASTVVAICACATLLISPLREKLLGVKKQDKAMMCMLRSDITRIYYKYLPTKQIPQYEYEAFDLLCEAYFALKGNSFVHKIHDEVKEAWSVVK